MVIFVPAAPLFSIMLRKVKNAVADRSLYPVQLLGLPGKFNEEIPADFHFKLVNAGDLNSVETVQIERACFIVSFIVIMCDCCPGQKRHYPSSY